MTSMFTNKKHRILVPRGRAPFGQHQESRPLAMSNTGSPQFTDFPSLCACSESSLTNLIGSGLNLLCFQSHSKTECRWTGPEVAILGADQKERGLWEREWKHRYKFQRSVILWKHRQNFFISFISPELLSVSYEVQHSFSTFGVARNELL